MPPQPDVLPSVVRFADFEVDLRAGELRKRGDAMRLQEQPLRILNMLLERPGDLITREELRRVCGRRIHLWTSITACIRAVARLRESLNDSAEAPRFVETVPRKGYRFIGELQDVELPQAPQLAAATLLTLNQGSHRVGPGAPWTAWFSFFCWWCLRTHGFPGKKTEGCFRFLRSFPLAGCPDTRSSPPFRRMAIKSHSAKSTGREIRAFTRRW